MNKETKKKLKVHFKSDVGIQTKKAAQYASWVDGYDEALSKTPKARFRTEPKLVWDAEYDMWFKDGEHEVIMAWDFFSQWCYKHAVSIWILMLTYLLLSIRF